MFRTCMLALSISLLLVAGCGKGEKIPPLAEVQGTLVDEDGNALKDVEVVFLPDPEKEVFGKPAYGVTDASGKFVLHYNKDRNKPGTAIGTNRVVLKDILAMRTSRDPEPVPRRFHKKYLNAKSTDLTFEVTDSDGQDFEIKVELSEY